MRYDSGSVAEDPFEIVRFRFAALPTGVPAIPLTVAFRSTSFLSPSKKCPHG